jgi:flagellar hook-associated protein 2
MVLRIGGLATGMDIDNLVKQLMNAHRAPVNKLFQRKQIFEWQRDAYREVNTKITDFRNTQLFNLRLEGTLSAKKAVVTGNTAAITATASSNAITGSLTIEVGNLAAAASNYGTNTFGTVDFDPAKTLADESTAGRLTGGTLSGSYSFKINGVQIDVDPTKQSLNSVIADINNKTNVSAFYDSTTRKISFVSKETGSVNNSADKKTITFEDLNGGDFLTTFVSVSNGSANEVAAVDASLNVNGMPTTRTSNTFTISGVEITLKEVSTGNPSTISTSVNTDKIVDSIKTFIADYNDVLKTLQDKLIEPGYRDFTPLTDEQKNDMSEKEIELWEEKAKSGLLRSDSILSKAVSNMRLAISAQVDNGSVYSTLSSVGIKTGSYTEKGKLYLADETKLRQAIEEDPDAVTALFAADGNGSPDRSGMGIAERMYDDLNSTLKDIKQKAGLFISLNDNSFISRQINYMETEITEKNNRLVDIESNYYRKFTAMETAISRFNSQSAYLANAFGGGQQ